MWICIFECYLSDVVVDGLTVLYRYYPAEAAEYTGIVNTRNRHNKHKHKGVGSFVNGQMIKNGVSVCNKPL